MPKYPRPTAYTGRQADQNFTGQARFATQAEANAGASDELIISPETLAGAIASVGGVTKLRGNDLLDATPTAGRINIVGQGGTTVFRTAVDTLAINVVGSDITWTAQAGPGPTLLLPDTGSYCTGSATLNLPVTPTDGSRCQFIIARPGLTVIVSGNGATILPDTGADAQATWTSTNQLGGSLDLVYRTAGNIWYTFNSRQAWT